MQFAADPSALESALDDVRGLIASKSTLAVLSNVLLEWDESTLEVWATNLETTARATCDIYADEGGRACLKGKQLYDLVRGLDAPEVDIQIEDNYWANLTAGDVDARIVGVHPDDYPQKPDTDVDTGHEIDADALLYGIERTVFSISTDDARANLTGAHWQPEGDQLRMTSTDGHRLSTVKIKASLSGYLPEDGVIVPKIALDQLQSVVDEDDGRVRFAITDEDMIVFDCDGTTIASQLINGTFPDFTKVLPDETEGDTFTATTGGLDEAVDFASMFASTSTNNLRLTLSDDGLELYASDPDRGEAQQMVDVQADVDDETKLGINHRYLSDVLSAIDDPEVAVTMLDTVSPMTVRPSESGDVLFVIMPMRL